MRYFLRGLVLALLLAGLPVEAQIINPGNGGSGGTPGGTSGQIQINNAGSFGGISTVPVGDAGLDTASTQINPQNIIRQYNGTAGAYLPQNQYVLNVDSLYLPHWTAALARVKNHDGNARIFAVGDSTTFGSFSNTTSNISSADVTKDGYPAILAADFASSGIPAQRNSWMGSFGASQNIYTNDARFVKGSFVSGGGLGAGDAVLSASSAGTPMSFTPNQKVDTFRVWYIVSPSAGTLTYNIDGGSPTTLSTTGTAAMASFTATTTLGIHTINVNWSSGGQVFINGMESYDGNQPSISVVNVGAPGATAFNLSGNAFAYSPLNAVPAMAPDLVLLDIGINDWNLGTTVATFKSNLQSLVTSYKTVSDVIIVTPAPSGIANKPLATQQQYIQAMYQVALTSNVPIIDMFTRWGSYEAKSVSPYLLYQTGQTVHPNMDGYGDFAQYIAENLLSVGGPGARDLSYVNIGSSIETSSMLAVAGGVSIGSSYIGTSFPAPTNGAIVQGNVAIGTSAIVSGSVLTLAGHLGFSTASIPVVTSCGSGTLATGSTDNKGQITGITAATGCTITFGTPLPVAPACAFATSTGIAAGGIPTTAAVTTTMALFTGTLAYQCF